LQPADLSLSFTDDSMPCSSSNSVKTSRKKKKVQHAHDFAKDIANLKSLAEGRASNKKKYAWLGSLVASQMDDIDAEDQAAVSWEIQCLMNKYVQKSMNKKKAANLNATDAQLETASPSEPDELNDEEVTDNFEMIIEELDESVEYLD